MTDTEEVQQAREALLGVTRDPSQRIVRRVKPSDIQITPNELSHIKATGITADQADNIAAYCRHIAARSEHALLGVKEATEYAKSLLRWAYDYATQAKNVRGSDMTKAYHYIMRNI